MGVQRLVHFHCLDRLCAGLGSIGDRQVSQISSRVVTRTNEGIRDVMIGMDASQMGESLYEDQWKGEEDYQPFAAAIQLE